MADEYMGGIEPSLDIDYTEGYDDLTGDASIEELSDAEFAQIIGADEDVEINEVITMEDLDGDDLSDEQISKKKCIIKSIQQRNKSRLEAEQRAFEEEQAAINAAENEKMMQQDTDIPSEISDADIVSDEIPAMEDIAIAKTVKDSLEINDTEESAVTEEIPEVGNIGSVSTLQNIEDVITKEAPEESMSSDDNAKLTYDQEEENPLFAGRQIEEVQVFSEEVAEPEIPDVTDAFISENNIPEAEETPAYPQDRISDESVLNEWENKNDIRPSDELTPEQLADEEFIRKHTDSVIENGESVDSDTFSSGFNAELFESFVDEPILSTISEDNSVPEEEIPEVGNIGSVSTLQNIEDVAEQKHASLSSKEVADIFKNLDTESATAVPGIVNTKENPLGNELSDSIMQNIAGTETDEGFYEGMRIIPADDAETYNSREDTDIRQPDVLPYASEQFADGMSKTVDVYDSSIISSVTGGAETDPVQKAQIQLEKNIEDGKDESYRVDVPQAESKTVGEYAEIVNPNQANDAYNDYFSMSPADSYAPIAPITSSGHYVSGGVEPEKNSKANTYSDAGKNSHTEDVGNMGGVDTLKTKESTGTSSVSEDSVGVTGNVRTKTDDADAERSRRGSDTGKHEKTEEIKREISEEEAVQRKFKTHANRGDFVEDLSSAGQAFASGLKTQIDDPESAESQGVEQMKKFTSVFGPVGDVLGILGSDSAAKMARADARVFANSAYDAEELIKNGTIKLDDLKKPGIPEDMLSDAKDGKAIVNPVTDKVVYVKKEYSGVQGLSDAELKKKLDDAGVPKWKQKGIIKNRDDIHDAVLTRDELTKFYDGLSDKKHAFAKTKVMGHNVVGVSRLESAKQTKVLLSDNKKFYNAFATGKLSKNMASAYFAAHQDEMLRKLNPAGMSQKDLKRFIKKQGKNFSVKDQAILRQLYKNNKISSKFFNKLGSVKILGSKWGSKGFRAFMRLDENSGNGIRHINRIMQGGKVGATFASLAGKSGVWFLSVTKYVNPVYLGWRFAAKPVGKYIGRKVKNKVTQIANRTIVPVTNSAKTAAKNAVSAAKNGAKNTAKKAAGKAVTNFKGAHPVASAKISQVKETVNIAKDGVKKAADKLGSAKKAVGKGFKKAANSRVARGASAVTGAVMTPFRWVADKLNLAKRVIKKVLTIIACIFAGAILVYLLLLVLAALIQSYGSSTGAITSGTIMDYGLEDRVKALQEKDAEKYQNALDIATSAPKHDAEHIDEKGLYPDEAYYGVKLYHYGSPLSPDAEDVDIYHNDIGGETTNGYHIYFLNSAGETVGTNSTNIKDALCLSTVMAGNNYANKNKTLIYKLQDDIFAMLNPEPTYTVSELYHKEGSDRFPYDDYTYQQKTYYCNDPEFYAEYEMAEAEGVAFYEAPVEETEHGCTFDQEAFDADYEVWEDSEPQWSDYEVDPDDYTVDWSDYEPDESDYCDDEGNFDQDAYDAAYEAASESYDSAVEAMSSAYDSACEAAESAYDLAVESWAESEPDPEDEKYLFCPGHPEPGTDFIEEPEISVSYGYRDINIYVTILTKDDVYEAYTSGSGVITYKVPLNYECTEWEEKEVEFEISSAYNKLIKDFEDEDSWENENNRMWCDALYEGDWQDMYGFDVYTNTTTLPSGKGLLSEQQIEELMESIEDTSAAREELVSFALSNVGAISYYWGGKAEYPGWEGNSFGTRISADYMGRTTKGLDCSGFVSWVYWTCTGVKPPGMSTSNFTTSLGLRRITYSQLRPGDIGLKSMPGAQSNHIGIFIGYDDATGLPIFCHCSGSPKNTVVVAPYTGFSVYYSIFPD